MEGYIKLYRQIIESEFYFSERFTKQQAWIDLLLLATHKERTVYLKGIEINLKPGQLFHSQVTLAKRWGWNRKTVKKFLNTLKNREMVDTKETNITTIISIKKWHLYQVDGQQNGQQRDSGVDTNKNVKNVKNVKKELIIAAAKYLITAIQKDTSFYSIINKYIKIFGEKRIYDILSGCINKENEFANENKLAAYFEVCKSGNGRAQNQTAEVYDATKSYDEGKDLHDIMKEKGLI